MSLYVSNDTINEAVETITMVIFTVEKTISFNTLVSEIRSMFPANVEIDKNISFDLDIKTRDKLLYRIDFYHNNYDGCLIHIFPFKDNERILNWYMWHIKLGSLNGESFVHKEKIPDPNADRKRLTPLGISYFKFLSNREASAVQGKSLNDFLSVSFESKKKIPNEYLQGNETHYVDNAEKLLSLMMMRVLGRINLATGLRTILTKDVYQTSNKKDFIRVVFHIKPMIYLERNSRQSKKFIFVIENRKVIKDLPEAILEHLDNN